MKYIIQIMMPSSGYAHNAPFYVGPFTSEGKAEMWARTHLENDPKVTSWEILPLNPTFANKGDWR